MTLIDSNVLIDIVQRDPAWFDWSSAALEDAAVCRARGTPTLVMPEGMNPRKDGRWDNPA